MEDYGDYIYIVIKMLYYEEKENIIKAEQISIILCKNLVITFQEGGGDVFEPIRERIRNSKGRLRGTGSDYLAYSLVDSIVDNYFIILEKFSDTLESLEEMLMEDITQYDLNELHTLKREMLFLRKSVWPVREIVGNLERSGSPLINQTTIIYLRDLYDHTVQVIDTIETVREMTTGMLEIYLSSMSNRMNEVMKVLTIMASIFIPLTFIAGVYGMNFDNMPELHSKFGYPMVVGLMILVAIIMIIFFKKRNWL
jgi:magnesium transporter